MNYQLNDHPLYRSLMLSIFRTMHDITSRSRSPAYLQPLHISLHHINDKYPQLHRIYHVPQLQMKIREEKEKRKKRRERTFPCACALTTSSAVNESAIRSGYLSI